MKKSRYFGWTFVSYPLCVEGTDGTVVISILGGTHGYAVCCMKVECKKVDISHPGLYSPPTWTTSRRACSTYGPVLMNQLARAQEQGQEAVCVAQGVVEAASAMFLTSRAAYASTYAQRARVLLWRLARAYERRARGR